MNDTAVAQDLHIDASRFSGDLAHLAGFSAEGHGVTRPAWSTEYFAARAWLAERGRDAGLEASVDPIGNLWLTWRTENESTLVMGSHIDSVPSAGRLDGCLGVLGGLEALRALRAGGWRPERTIRLVAWIEEEGTTTGRTLLGSSVFTGELPRELALQPDTSEISGLGELIGSDPDRALSWAGFDLDTIEAYLELHIEQGPVLDAAGDTIGVVDGIVGYRSLAVAINGVSNHAGTTPMNGRSDALATGARLTLDARNLARALGLTATVGTLRVDPNAANVIAGRVELTVDVRGLHDAVLDNFGAQLQQAANHIDTTEGTTTTLTTAARVPAAHMNADVQQTITDVAKAYGYGSRRITSGALHDAAPLARKVPVGMIFVPSTAGISHSPREHTSVEDCVSGIRVLGATLARLGHRSRTDRTSK